MDEALLRTLTPTVIGVLVRRGADFAAAEDMTHFGTSLASLGSRRFTSAATWSGSALPAWPETQPL